MATVTLKNINKVYDGGVHAVVDFNLNIKDREFIVFVGPSGCGKTTTLRMIAGLDGEPFASAKQVVNPLFRHATSFRAAPPRTHPAR